MDLRVAEYLLLQNGYKTHRTPVSISSCTGWMRDGFRFHERINELGYLPYPNDGTRLQWLEASPNACFEKLIGKPLLSSRSIVGLLQRQLLLFETGLFITDPMDFFVEVTRHHLMSGRLPLNMIYSSSEIDAMLLAYMAWLSSNKPEEVILFGDEEEGQIALPASPIV